MAQMVRCSMHQSCTNEKCFHKQKHTPTCMCHTDYICSHYGDFELKVSCEVVYDSNINIVGKKDGNN